MITFNFKNKTEDFKTWISFYPKRNKGTGFNLTFANNGYFDPRPEINTNITTLLALVLPFFSLWLLPISLFFCFFSWGSLYIHLPYDTGNGETSESKTYGLTFYHADSGFPNQFWVRGWKSFDFPWAYKFYKREVLTKDGWTEGDSFYDDAKRGDKIIKNTYDYIYTLNSGKKQERKATIYTQRIYCRRWFNLQTKCRQYIEIEFNDEVGERSGSWKGGCIGCSYTMKPNETALETLRRMEKERKF